MSRLAGTKQGRAGRPGPPEHTRWKPGQSGNPRGRPPGFKPIPAHLKERVRELARFIIDDPAYQASLIDRLMKGRAPHVETLLWHHAYGAPAQTMKHDVGDRVVDFAAALKKAWDALQAAGDPRVPKAIGPASTVVELLPHGTIPTNGRRDGRVYVGLEDQEDDSDELWPGDIS